MKKGTLMKGEKMKKEVLTTAPKNIGQLVISLLLMFCGAYILFNPVAALMTTSLILGIFFIVTGIGYFFVFYYNRSYMLMMMGVLDVLIGLIFVCNLGLTAQTIPIIFALWCLFIGVTQIASSFEMKDIQINAWKWVFILGLLSVLFAFLIFFHPAIGILTITLLMGSYLIIYGLFEFARFILGY